MYMYKYMYIYIYIYIYIHITSRASSAPNSIANLLVVQKRRKISAITPSSPPCVCVCARGAREVSGEVMEGQREGWRGGASGRARGRERERKREREGFVDPTQSDAPANPAATLTAKALNPRTLRKPFAPANPTKSTPATPTKSTPANPAVAGLTHLAENLFLVAEEIGEPLQLI